MDAFGPEQVTAEFRLHVLRTEHRNQINVSQLRAGKEADLNGQVNQRVYEAEQNQIHVLWDTTKLSRPTLSKKGVSDLTLPVHFSICACHPCEGAMLISSVSFQLT